ncbi:Swt1 family HEPN domain-containing protein [Anaeromyxobacter sp. Red801]|uniref:Swt1 family HEPN domain-containing protein n=1 Tax=Anaeromyxobacter sp. Red801 TaxID=3411632 RepID=UPI003BA05F8F
MDRDRLAMFLMLGQTARRVAHAHPETVPPESLRISGSLDLAVVLPAEVRDASRAAEVYRLFFVFEQYLRDLVLGVLSEKDKENWWTRVPPDVQTEVAKLEENEETKFWMGLGSRDKISLTTYPQLLRIIEHLWKEDFEEVLRDRSLVQEARHVAHLRNITCHMNVVPIEEVERVRIVLRDWFRAVAP